MVRMYADGSSPEMIGAQYPSLPLPLIHRVIAFYPENQGEVDIYMAAHDKEIDRVRMQGQLEEHMNLKEDQCVIIDLGPDEATAREAATVLGPSLPKGDAGMLVI